MLGTFDELAEIVGLGAPAEASSAEKTASSVGEFAEIAGAAEATTVSDETTPRTPVESPAAVVQPIPNKLSAPITIRASTLLQ